jgi:hypothetical protein
MPFALEDLLCTTPVFGQYLRNLQQFVLSLTIIEYRKEIDKIQWCERFTRGKDAIRMYVCFVRDCDSIVINANRIREMKSRKIIIKPSTAAVHQAFLPCPAFSTPRAILLVPSSTPFPREAKASPSGFPVLPVTPVTVLPTCGDCQHKLQTNMSD